MYCGTCGERIKSGEKICPFCGSEQTTLPQWKGISLDFISDKEEKEEPLEKTLKTDRNLSDTKSKEEDEIFYRSENLESSPFDFQDTKRKLKQNGGKQKKVSGISGIVKVSIIICVAVLILSGSIYIRALQRRNDNLGQKLERMEKLEAQLQEQQIKYKGIAEKQKAQKKQIEAQEKQMNELEGQIAEIREDLDMNTAEEDFFDAGEAESEEITERMTDEDKIPESEQEVISSDGYSQEDYSSDEQ